MSRAPILSVIFSICVSCSNGLGQAALAATPGKGVLPANSWSHVASPEAAGWSKGKLSAAREYANSIHSSAVMIIEHGEVVDEWGDTDQKISSYSVRKSLISALYGIYSSEGVININETLGTARHRRQPAIAHQWRKTSQDCGPLACPVRCLSSRGF